MTDRARIGRGARRLAIAVGSGLVLLWAGVPAAQQIGRPGFNFDNIPPCPGHAVSSVMVDKFTDGAPLPSCGGREWGPTTPIRCRNW